MILLLGGTSETAAIAEHLGQAGLDVMVSTATAVPLDVGRHPGIRRQSGRLDAAGMERLVRDHGVRAVVDAGHPYAVLLHATARAVADRVRLPYFRYLRPAAAIGDAAEFILHAPDHTAAARAAFSFRQPVLLTTGSNNLDPYVQESDRRHVPLAARVLPGPESLQACRKAGLDDSRVIAQRGPFSKAQNQEHIRRFRAGVLVTKESGVEGGFVAKLEAAREERCQVVIIQRPVEPAANSYSSVRALVSAVKEVLEHP